VSEASTPPSPNQSKACSPGMDAKAFGCEHAAGVWTGRLRPRERGARQDGSARISGALRGLVASVWKRGQIVWGACRGSAVQTLWPSPRQSTMASCAATLCGGRIGLAPILIACPPKRPFNLPLRMHFPQARPGRAAVRGKEWFKRRSTRQQAQGGEPTPRRAQRRPAPAAAAAAPDGPAFSCRCLRSVVRGTSLGMSEILPSW
jgi:hypothetical protein